MRPYYLTRPFVSLWAQNFLFFISLNTLNVLPDHLLKLGATHTYIGLFMNLSSLALVLLVVPMNHITQRVGRKTVLAVGYATTIVATVWMVLLTRNLVLLLVARSLATLAFCATFTIYGAEAFEVVPKDRRVGGLAVFGVSGILSNPVATFLGERILATGRPAWLFVASGSMLAVAFVLSLLYRWHRPEPETETPRLVRILLRPELRGLILLAFAMGGTFSIYVTYLANLTSEILGVVRISVFFAAFSAIAVISRLFLAPVIDRTHKGWLATVCLTCTTGSFALSALLAPGGGWLLIVMGLAYGIGHSLLFPLMMTLFVGTGSEREKLEMNSIFVSSLTLGGLLISVALGALGDVFGTRTIFTAMIGICALAAALAYAAVRPALRAAA